MRSNQFGQPRPSGFSVHPCVTFFKTLRSLDTSLQCREEPLCLIQQSGQSVILCTSDPNCGDLGAGHSYKTKYLGGGGHVKQVHLCFGGAFNES